MADNYTLFSATLDNITEEERVWWEEEVSPLSIDADEDDIKVFAFKMGIEEEAAEYYPEFEWAYQAYHNHIWIYSEEGGNLENVANTVKTFLAKFRPNEIWSMEFAFTCSKPRIGEFGGGAMIVTATDIKWLNTTTWIQSEVAALSNEKGGAV